MDGIKLYTDPFGHVLVSTPNGRALVHSLPECFKNNILVPICNYLAFQSTDTNPTVLSEQEF